VHERGGDGQTPLHFARSRAVAGLLLDAGADPDARDVDHRSTPAQWMIGDGAGSPRFELARHLVERGASADIFLAAALGLTERVQSMLDADPALLRLRTGDGEYAAQPPSAQHIYQWTIGGHRSPMHAAAKFGQRATLAVMERYATPEDRLLVACHVADADAARAVIAEHPGIVERLGPVERGALTEEAWAANAPAVELMLELGFDPAALGATAHNGGSALHCAAWQGSGECVAAILRRPNGRALIEVRDRRYDATPLGWCGHGSVNRGNPRGAYADIARQLIAAGARVDPDLLDGQGSEEFMSAIEEALTRG
jgi:ankyrin repeat protein